jgi:hypothetical protein
MTGHQPRVQGVRTSPKRVLGRLVRALRGEPEPDRVDAYVARAKAYAEATAEWEATIPKWWQVPHLLDEAAAEQERRKRVRAESRARRYRAAVRVLDTDRSVDDLPF